MGEAKPEHSADLLEANKRLLEKRAVAKSEGVQGQDND